MHQDNSRCRSRRDPSVQHISCSTLHMSCSIAGAPGPALSTSGEASAASCSPAACAQPAQQHCTKTRRQHPTVTSTSEEQPAAPQCRPPPLLCSGSIVADQQAHAPQAVPVPAAIGSSMDGFAAAHQFSDESSITPRPRQPSVLAEPVLLSVPPLTATQKSKGRQTRSATAVEVMIQEPILCIKSDVNQDDLAMDLSFAPA